jgi:hypothetical protein
MRPAFTLVEVIAAAAIAAIAGIALLQMNSQNMFLFSRLTETAAVSETLSLIGNHADKRFNHATKSLYDMLDNTYQIENDELRKYLQNDKYDYSENVVDTISLAPDAMPAVGETISDIEMQDASAAPAVQFELVQVSIKKEGKHGAVLIARPL